MEAADREGLARELARQARDACDAVERAVPDEGLGLERFGRAARRSIRAAMAGVDVQPLDDAIDIGFALMKAAGRNPARLFPPAGSLLETLSCMAWCHLERFPYRLVVFDLVEANRYAEDALALGGGTLAGPVRIRAESVIAGVALRRHGLTGDVRGLDAAIARLGPAVGLLPDEAAIATLAACLRQRADALDADAARRDLQVAGRLLDSLLAEGAGSPPTRLQPLLRARWLAERARVHATKSRHFGGVADLRHARALVRQALELWPRSGEALLANAMIEGTVEACERVLDLARSPSDSAIVLRGAEALAGLAAASGALEKAAPAAEFAWRLLQRAIDNQVDDAHRTLWLPRLHGIALIAASARAATGDLTGAVDCAESIRTRILRESFPDEDNELFELAAAGHHDLSASLRRALDVMRASESSMVSRSRARDLLRSDSEMVRRLPGFSTFRANPDACAIAAAIETPVAYLVPGDRGGVALIVRPGEGPLVAVALPLCTNEPPAEVERFRKAAFAAGMPAGARRNAVNLVSAWAWNAVHRPLASALPGIERVHLIGLSYLALIPIHAAREQSPVGMHHAIAEIEYRYAPSARALMAATRRQIPAIEPRFMVVPQPAGAGIELQGARAEVDAVARHFDAPVVLPDAEITSVGLREAIGGAGWLHVACHGIADAENPLSSGLVLRDGERFRLSDLFGANQRHLLLTVLSACQTNVPDIRLPDETTSLAAGLFVGGCRAVIASAWQVPDAATSALMRCFYTRWRRDGLEVPQALRSAQLTFALGGDGIASWREEWSEPYFWAGFSYLGP